MPRATAPMVAVSLVLSVICSACAAPPGAATSASGTSAPASSSVRPSGPTPSASAPSTADTPSSGPAPRSGAIKIERTCENRGARLHRYGIVVDFASGHVASTDQGAPRGDANLTQTQLTPLGKLIGGGGLEPLFAERPKNEAHGEGRSCTLVVERAGLTKKISWSSYDALADATKDALKALEAELVALDKLAVDTVYGDPCAVDADCHLGQGPDCTCVAAGPPKGAGWVSKCVAFPCADTQKAVCETSLKRCVLR